MAVIFYVSSLHQAPLPPGVSDKPAHAFGYMGFGFVIARALAGGLPPRITLRDLFIGIAIAVAYAASDEVPPAVRRRADRRNSLICLPTRWAAAIALGACWAWGIISLHAVAGRPLQPAAP